MLFEALLASSVLFSTNTTNFTQENKYSILPEAQTIHHYHVYYKSQQEIPKQIYYSKNEFSGILTLNHISKKTFYLEACYTGKVYK